MSYDSVEVRQVASRGSQVQTGTEWCVFGDVDLRQQQHLRSAGHEPPAGFLK